MKYLVLLSLFGSLCCVPKQSCPISLKEQAKVVVLNNSNGIDEYDPGLIIVVKTGFTKFVRFFMGKKNLPHYCHLLLESSPTLSDFKKLWPMDSLAQCADGDLQCREMERLARIRNLQCYED